MAIIQKCTVRNARTYRSSCLYADLGSTPIASCKTVPNLPRRKEILATEELHTRIFLLLALVFMVVGALSAYQGPPWTLNNCKDFR